MLIENMMRIRNLYFPLKFAWRIVKWHVWYTLKWSSHLARLRVWYNSWASFQMVPPTFANTNPNSDHYLFYAGQVTETSNLRALDRNTQDKWSKLRSYELSIVIRWVLTETSILWALDRTTQDKWPKLRSYELSIVLRWASDRNFDLTSSLS